MAKIFVEQFIKEQPESNIDLKEEYDILGCVEEPERFSYIVKFEKKISKKHTEIKISYRDTRINMDYKVIHESNKKEEYKSFIKFFKQQGYYKL